MNENDLTDKERSIRDKSWTAILSLIHSGKEPDIYQRNRRGVLVKAAAENNDTSVVMVYKYLRRYWQRGMIKKFSHSDYANSGGLGKTKTAGTAKRGRRRKNLKIQYLELIQMRKSFRNLHIFYANLNPKRVLSGVC